MNDKPRIGTKPPNTPLPMMSTFGYVNMANPSGSTPRPGRPRVTRGIGVLRRDAVDVFHALLEFERPEALPRHPAVMGDRHREPAAQVAAQPKDWT
jgi:hypothetical protein